jgi:hypothetical protein
MDRKAFVQLPPLHCPGIPPEIAGYGLPALQALACRAVGLPIGDGDARLLHQGFPIGIILPPSCARDPLAWGATSSGIAAMPPNAR